MHQKRKLQTISHWLKVSEHGDHMLHLVEFVPEVKTQSHVIVMNHGSIEDGKIYYSSSHKGLAPFLCRQGFSVFVLDHRGKGQSTPLIGRHSKFGQNEMITQDLPALCQWICEKCPENKQIWINHSWGGVLLASMMARGLPDASALGKISGMVFFGTKRIISVFNRERFLMIDLIWNRLFSWIAQIFGYLPTRFLRFGSADESLGFLKDCKKWIKRGSKWIDTKDGFDYLKASQKISYPPLLSIAADQDYCLGHPIDVEAFIKEMGAKNVKNILLKDHDHVSMLTDPKHESDLFLEIVSWIENL